MSHLTHPGLDSDSPELICIPMNPDLLMARFSSYRLRRAATTYWLIRTTLLTWIAIVSVVTGNFAVGAGVALLSLVSLLFRRCLCCHTWAFMWPQAEASWCPNCGGLIGDIYNSRLWLRGAISIRVIKRSVDPIVKWMGLILEASEEINAKTIRIRSECNGGQVTLLNENSLLIGEVAFIGERDVETSSGKTIKTDIGKMAFFLSNQIALCAVVIFGEWQKNRCVIGTSEKYRIALECTCDSNTVDVKLTKHDLMPLALSRLKYSPAIKKRAIDEM